MVNKSLIRSYFWGGDTLGGGWLTSHETNWCEGLHDFVGLVRNSDVLSESNRVKTILV